MGETPSRPKGAAGSPGSRIKGTLAHLSALRASHVMGWSLSAVNIITITASQSLMLFVSKQMYITESSITKAQAIHISSLQLCYLQAMHVCTAVCGRPCLPRLTCVHCALFQAHRARPHCAFETRQTPRLGRQRSEYAMADSPLRKQDFWASHSFLTPDGAHGEFS